MYKCEICDLPAIIGTSNNPFYAEKYYCHKHIPEVANFFVSIMNDNEEEYINSSEVYDKTLFGCNG